jgi:SAM-dependent methyltransferase
MLDYWETKFKEEGAMWKFEPSDSALVALDLFKSKNIKKVLIPGVGYGRNAKIFIENEFDITGIEISKTAIDLAKSNGLQFNIHYGSVTSMPYDNFMYDGIFCYALIHLLNKNERKKFLISCYKQLKTGGLMIFAVVSTNANIYGIGKQLSNNRFELKKGLNVYFYNSESVKNEFNNFGLIEYRNMDEPMKHLGGSEPLKFILVICEKK